MCFAFAFAFAFATTYAQGPTKLPPACIRQANSVDNLVYTNLTNSPTRLTGLEGGSLSTFKDRVCVLVDFGFGFGFGVTKPNTLAGGSALLNHG